MAYDLPESQLLLFSMAAVASGAVSGLLGGVFGIGGGAILVTVFYEFLAVIGVDESVRMHLSVGTSLALIVPTSIRSTLGHHARGAVDVDFLRSLLVPVPAGVVAASILAASISSEGLRLVFAVTAALLGLRMLFQRESWRLGSKLPGNPWRSIVGAGIGFLSTLMGVGGGVMNNTFMTLYGRSIHQAVATSSGVGVLIAVPATLGYIWAGWGDPLLPVGSIGYVNLIALALMMPVVWPVTPYGVTLAHWLSRRQLEIGFGMFLMFVSGRFAWSLWT